MIMTMRGLKAGDLSWDGLWRVVAFDIKEVRRGDRDLFRRELRNLDFYLLQQSVWVTPYPCEELIHLLKAEFGLQKQIVYMIVQVIEDDQELRKHFRLPSG